MLKTVQIYVNTLKRKLYSLPFFFMVLKVLFLCLCINIFKHKFSEQVKLIDSLA